MLFSQNRYTLLIITMNPKDYNKLKMIPNQTNQILKMPAIAVFNHKYLPSGPIWCVCLRTHGLHPQAFAHNFCMLMHQKTDLLIQLWTGIIGINKLTGLHTTPKQLGMRLIYQ